MYFVHLVGGLCSSFGVLDDVLKGQGSVKHHGLLAGNHLTVYRVVEMSNLQENNNNNIKKKMFAQLATCICKFSTQCDGNVSYSTSTWVGHQL